MKKCLLIVNASGGNAKKIKSNNKLRDELRLSYNIAKEVQITAEDGYFDIASACKNFQAVCVSGGDGTLNSAINAIRDLDIDLIYHPCGTINDFAKSQKIAGKRQKLAGLPNQKLTDIGEINGHLFSYVAAAGTFTSIGYTPKTRHKKFFRRLAYWISALVKFRLHKIKAKINMDGRLLEDTYTLIMAVKSKCVFGFKFNKLYKHNSGKGHLLLIKTPTGIFRRWKLFCNFFTAFFVGFKKIKDSKNIKFLEFDNVSVELESEQNFCVDGEKYVSQKQNLIKIHKEKLNISIV